MAVAFCGAPEEAVSLKRHTSRSQIQWRCQDLAEPMKGSQPSIETSRFSDFVPLAGCLARDGLPIVRRIGLIE